MLDLLKAEYNNGRLSWCFVRDISPSDFCIQGIQSCLKLAQLSFYCVCSVFEREIPDYLVIPLYHVII